MRFLTFGPLIGSLLCCLSLAKATDHEATEFRKLVRKRSLVTPLIISVDPAQAELEDDTYRLHDDGARGAHRAYWKDWGEENLSQFKGKEHDINARLFDKDDGKPNVRVWVNTSELDKVIQKILRMPEVIKVSIDKRSHHLVSELTTEFPKVVIITKESKATAMSLKTEMARIPGVHEVGWARGNAKLYALCLNSDSLARARVASSVADVRNATSSEIAKVRERPVDYLLENGKAINVDRVQAAELSALGMRLKRP